MHATIMIFFVVMPIMVGTFGNFLIPLMIGTRDMAFPKLNMLSFWVGAIATCVCSRAFLFLEVRRRAVGQVTRVVRESAIHRRRMDKIWIISLLILGVSSLMGSINYIRPSSTAAPGMTYFRMPFDCLVALVTAILLLLALPVLTRR